MENDARAKEPKAALKIPRANIFATWKGGGVVKCHACWWKEIGRSEIKKRFRGIYAIVWLNLVK